MTPRVPPPLEREEQGRCLEVFVPGPLFNPVNGSHGHWSKRARWARQWKERTLMAWFLKYQRRGELAPTAPKRIQFLAQTGARWDDDNLRVGLKPVRDALRDLGLIHDDGPDSGHEFTYAQQVNRTERGVRITITPREAATR